MSMREISFKSFNGRDDIQAIVFTPITEPKGIVQVVHGLGEHSRRYLHLMLTLCDAGYVVAADDHVGHGKTAMLNNTWANFGGAGYMTATNDENSLRKILQDEFPDIPYFMFGHSWGSFLIRNYLANYGEGVKGVILCGTCGNMPRVPELLADVTKAVEEGRGAEAEPERLLKLIEDWPEDWICGDMNVVNDTLTDPYQNQANFDNQSYYEFLTTINAITGIQWAERVPTNVAVFNIAGDGDPTGQYGEGVYIVSNWLIKTGHKVKTHVYPGLHHEILNYREHRDGIEAEIVEFLKEQL